MCPIKQCFLSMLFCITFLAHELYPQEPTRMTIFVHGVIGLRHYISLKTFIKLFHNGRHIPYEQSISRIREDPFFFQNQPIQWLGLHSVDMYDRKIGAAASLFSFIFDALSPCPHQTHYYTFGWSGLAGSSAALEAAEDFYHALREELAKPKFKDKKVVIDVIGYSRGGNITLNLAKFREQYPGDTFTINTVALIGTPVLRESRELITSPLFNKVYHFYSRKDWVQNNDFFSCTQLVSARRFKCLSEGMLNDKLTQAEIRVTQVTPSGRHYIDRSASHNELWFFAWPTPSCAERSPIRPFPLAAFLSMIIDRLETSAPDIKDAVVELRPQQEIMLIRQRHCQQPCYTAPFVSMKLINELRKQAYSQKPPCYTKKIFKAHAHSAIKQAQPCRIPIKRHRRCSLCGA